MDLIRLDHKFSKRGAESLSKELSIKVKDGFENALHIQCAIKYYEEVFKQVKEEIKQDVATEFSKYGGRKAEAFGYSMQESESGVSYDYSTDAIWMGLNEELESLKEKLKQRESALKLIKDKGNWVMNPLTSELYEEVAPVKKSTTIIKFTLQK